MKQQNFDQPVQSRKQPSDLFFSALFYNFDHHCVYESILLHTDLDEPCDIKQNDKIKALCLKTFRVPVDDPDFQLCLA